MKECKEAHIFTTGRKTPTICDEFKVLASLRIWGRNYVTASVCEFLGAAKTTINDFSKLFLVNYLRVFYKKYVYIPDELVGLNEVERVYRYMGLPGCLLGSMDVTHVQWELVPQSYVIIVLVVTDILLLGSTLYVHTIDVFNIYISFTEIGFNISRLYIDVFNIYRLDCIPGHSSVYRDLA